jgi:hypothetical protein
MAETGIARTKYTNKEKCFQGESTLNSDEDNCQLAFGARNNSICNQFLNVSQSFFPNYIFSRTFLEAISAGGFFFSLYFF